MRTRWEDGACLSLGLDVRPKIDEGVWLVLVELDHRVERNGVLRSIRFLWHTAQGAFAVASMRVQC